MYSEEKSFRDKHGADQEIERTDEAWAKEWSEMATKLIIGNYGVVP